MRAAQAGLGSGRRGGTRAAAALAGAAVTLHLVLILPNHPDAATWGALRVFPLELPVLLIALILARGRVAGGIRAGVTVALTITTVLKLADFGAYAAFRRAFNPALDLHLLAAGWRLLQGAVGAPLAVAAVAALGGAMALLAAALWAATGRIAALTPGSRQRRMLALALAPLALIAVGDAARETSPVDPPGAAFTARLAWEHARDIGRARADLAAFRSLAAADPAGSLPPEAILPALRGRDVLVVFVESYGRAALETAAYAPSVTATLRSAEARLAAAGLAMRSGYLTSPVVGGQSWLAHATLLSGLTVDTQGRYRALTASPRRTLLHLARAAGWRTVAVMPAITLPWPEGAFFGYDRVLAAADLGYAGRPFNWVTMPDQFTLAAFERAELSQAGRPSVFAEIALISSHAPFTPVPPLLPWDDLGDGRIFDPFAQRGPAPEALWRDLDAVRDAFRRALLYSLGVVAEFAERRADAAPLIVVLGDHQPASFVSLDTMSRDVPVHVIGAPDAMERTAAWNWTPGLVPAPDAPVWGMGDFRDRFLATFARPLAGPCAAPSGALPTWREC